MYYDERSNSPFDEGCHSNNQDGYAPKIFKFEVIFI